MRELNKVTGRPSKWGRVCESWWMGREKQKKATYLTFRQDRAMKETWQESWRKREEETVDRGPHWVPTICQAAPLLYTCDLICIVMPVSQRKTESTEIKSFPESHKPGNNRTPKSPQFSIWPFRGQSWLLKVVFIECAVASVCMWDTVGPQTSPVPYPHPMPTAL